MTRKLEPPFQTYVDASVVCIADAHGHICTADSPEIAEAILACLNSVVAPHPVVPAKPGLTPERVLDWIELSVLRVRDSERKRSVSHDPAVRILTEICEHIAAFRKEFKDHG